MPTASSPDSAWNNLGPKPGSRWRQIDSGRIIRILESEVHGQGPSWLYEDAGENTPENWHYCFVDAFLPGGEYEFVSVADPGINIEA